MPRSTLSVTLTDHDDARVPDAFAQGAALVLDLNRRGQLEAIAERLRIRREGGYSAVDVFVLLVLFFAHEARIGLRPFWERVRPVHRRLAALAGRRSLPAPASVSRALSRANAELLRPALPWLLFDVAGVEDVLRHPAVQSTDAQGQGWHVFDLDPTVTALRQRALPSRTGLPEAHRRAGPDLAVPGYPGRKRGDVQFARTTLQHSGSGLWLDLRISPGNGDRRAELPEALARVREVAARLNHPLDRCLVRADGAFGWVPDLHAFRDAGVPVITRLTRPKLLDQDDVQRLLAEADWTFVPDSGSGPRRSAADLGFVTVLPGKDTRRPDGSRYPPIRVRVVASRFRRSGAKVDHGVLLDGWQVELFVADVSPAAWPAAEVVAAYFGRSAEENRYAQEDRTYGLDRIFSYHLPGQELATAIALMVDNQRIARGFDLCPPPAVRPPAPPPLERDPRPFCAPPPLPKPPPPPPPSGPTAEEVLLDGLDALDWPRLLRRRPGWRWERSENGLVCPDGAVATLTCINHPRNRRPRYRLMFRAPVAACRSCERRGDCLASVERSRPKIASFAVSSEAAERLRPLLQAAHLGRRKARSLTAALQATGGEAESRPVRHDGLLVEPLQERGGTSPVAHSLFLPAQARRAFASRFHRATLRVEVDLPPPQPGRPTLLARTRREKQHGRATWSEHLRRYALPSGAAVRVQMAGMPAPLVTPEDDSANARALRRVSGTGL